MESTNVVQSTPSSIIAENLTKRYGRQLAIKDLSFNVKKGEVVGFLGPNGAGKSTTLRILTGALQADSGYAEVGGLPVASHPLDIRKRIGFMPENNPLPEDLRVIEYLRFRARIKGIRGREERKAVDRAMEICQLHRKARRKIIGTLSKGFRQRVGIADAILAKPELTILDEPTIGLDPHQVISIRKLLQTLKGETTVIFSSHILSEVELSCDRVIILNQGYLVASGTKDTLRDEFIPGVRFKLEFSGNLPSFFEKLSEICPEMQLESSIPLSGNLNQCRLFHKDRSLDAAGILSNFQRINSVQIHAFTKIEPTLEDVFLAATKQNWARDPENEDSRTPNTENPT